LRYVRSRRREAGAWIRGSRAIYNTLAYHGKEGTLMNDHEIFELGDVVLQQGATLRDAKLA
jgi:hypothetical protein